MSDGSKEFPDALALKPLSRPPQVTLRVPGSKSITNRALILAALSAPDTGSQLRGVLRSEDTEVMAEALAALGYRVRTDWPRSLIHVRRGEHTSPVPADQANLFVANSGTSMRFLTALVSLGQGQYRLDGISRMRERPIEDLLSALRQLGAEAFCEGPNGYPPVIVRSSGLNGGPVRIHGNLSSQFLSGLLMVAPLARGAVTIDVEGPLVSRPYVAMTVAMMEHFGVQVETDLASHFRVSPVPWYASRDYEIEPDATAAGYFLAAAAITRGTVGIEGLGKHSLQGDVAFADLLCDMGCEVCFRKNQISVTGGALHGITVDMNGMSDCVMTLAAVACFAEGPTTIRNVAHIRHKETDRLLALATELRRIGVGVKEFADGLTITPGPLHGATVETYNDHRIAMSMALIGLCTPGMVIRNPSCVAKTYPAFFEDLERLR
jgi:3-phosphoshikimate 1-carboxyvinyltransferase